MWGCSRAAPVPAVGQLVSVVVSCTMRSRSISPDPRCRRLLVPVSTAVTPERPGLRQRRLSIVESGTMRFGSVTRVRKRDRLVRRVGFRTPAGQCEKSVVSSLAAGAQVVAPGSPPKKPTAASLWSWSSWLMRPSPSPGTPRPLHIEICQNKPCCLHATARTAPVLLWLMAERVIHPIPSVRFGLLGIMCVCAASVGGQVAQP